MRVSYAKCDACKRRLGEGHKESDALIEIRAWYASRDYDVCDDCWRKMCAAAGLDPNLKGRPDTERVSRIPRDPTSGKLMPQNAEDWRAVLDAAGLHDVEVPT